MEDLEIINLYLKRAESAITETAKKYGRYCKSIAWRILSNEQDSEECVNDTYLGAWNAMPPQRPSYLAVFLGRITRNIALDKFAYKTAKKRNSEFDVILSELGDIDVFPGLGYFTLGGHHYTLPAKFFADFGDIFGNLDEGVIPPQ